MPYEYRIEPQDSILWIELSDPTNPAEIVEGIQRLCTDPALYTGLQVLSDLRNLDFVATPELAKTLPTLFIMLGEKIGPFRAAVVAPNEATFGMVRMTEMLSDDNPADVRPFWSLEEARAWLSGDAEE
ncbi:MAG: hypothetical protein ABJ308_04275 [Halieaceae bacterium]